MRYTFLGKPDKTFPDLITGQIYDLEIEVRSGRVMIVKPFFCPYLSWALFHQNWLHYKRNFTDAELDKAILSARERLDRAGKVYTKQEMFEETRREARRIVKADKHRRSLIKTLRHEEAREQWVKFAYYVFFLALLYAFVILSCVPR